MDEELFVLAEIQVIERIFFMAKEILPMFVFVAENGKRRMMPVVHGDDAEKDMVAAEVSRIVMEMKPAAVIHITEVWTVEMKPGDELKVRPSQSPNRVERVMIAVEFKTGGCWLASAKILRNKYDGSVRLDKWEVDGKATSSGRFTGWFKRGSLQ